MRMTWQAASHPNPVGGQDFALKGTVRRITGALWLPERWDEATPMVLLGHGASGDRYQKPIPYLVERFTREAGFVAVALDGPVHGLRQVGAGGREAFAEEMSRPQFLRDMTADWMDTLQGLRQAEGIGNGPLGYYGPSMGTLFGLPLLATHEQIHAAALGLAGTTAAARHIAADLMTAARAVKQPVVFLMQLEDELFPRDGYLELFDAIAADDKRLHANPGLHPQIPMEEIDFCFEFLRRHLLGEAQRRIINPLSE